MADAPVEAKLKKERVVEAEIIKNTSVAGMMLQRGSRHMLPITLAKSLQAQGLARPVPKVVESHPAPPAPPLPAFEGGEDDEEPEEEDEEEE